MRKSTLYL